MTGKELMEWLAEQPAEVLDGEVMTCNRPDLDNESASYRFVRHAVADEGERPYACGAYMSGEHIVLVVGE